jgi:hypothetical protein
LVGLARFPITVRNEGTRVIVEDQTGGAVHEP